MTTELGRLIARRIALTGPISLADFMSEALGHPRLGYYRTAQPLGAAGDFTTAPEISQMFGELVGAWLAERWQAMGAPQSVRLVELGPGRGTLMADALRATRGVPGFHAAIDLHLVDINQKLRAAQQEALGAYRPTWHKRLEELPPAILPWTTKNNPNRSPGTNRSSSTKWSSRGLTCTMLDRWVHR